MTATTFTPTDEQQHALDLFRTGTPLALQAGAGTGKTSTLKLLAQTDERTGQYLAFNRAIVDDAKATMPTRVRANTAHSLAFATHGKRFQHRLRSGRIKSEDVAKRLAIDPLTITTAAGKKRLAPGFLAGYLMRAVGAFCQSADETPGSQHFPYLDGIDLPKPDGTRTYDNQREVRDHLLRPLAAAWADLSSTDGALRFTHDCYLKLWQLDRPVIGADYVMLDEAQDTNPVLLDVFWRQADHAQLVAVGDDCQAIYEWRGAVNALGALVDLGAQTAYLSQSFRFGPAVATVANRLLKSLAAPLRLTGLETIHSVVGELDQADAVLTRTNAGAMRVLFDAMRDGLHPHIVGGGTELASFARGAMDLQTGRRTTHPELACFESWSEVKDYVANDQQGDELRLLVGLVDEFTAAKILETLDRMPSEGYADVIISTAHKAKGREWRTVKLHNDFPDGEKDVSDPELRLLYVAVTRAREALDISEVGYLNPKVRPCPGCGRTDVRTADGALLFDGNHLGCTGQRAVAG